MKIGLCNGLCGRRFICLNVNKRKKCPIEPKDDEDFVECDNFKKKKIKIWIK